MMVPEGSRADEGSKIFAFKVHRAKLPVLDGKGWLIPIEVEEFFQNGELDHAVKEAAESDYGVKNASYQFQPTIRYMGIFHGVRPVKYALSCKDCHGENSRMDWKQLGYGSDPAAVKATK